MNDAKPSLDAFINTAVTGVGTTPQERVFITAWYIQHCTAYKEQFEAQIQQYALENNGAVLVSDYIVPYKPCILYAPRNQEQCEHKIQYILNKLYPVGKHKDSAKFCIMKDIKPVHDSAPTYRPCVREPDTKSVGSTRGHFGPGRFTFECAQRSLQSLDTRTAAVPRRVKPMATDESTDGDGSSIGRVSPPYVNDYGVRSDAFNSVLDDGDYDDNVLLNGDDLLLGDSDPDGNDLLLGDSDPDGNDLLFDDELLDDSDPFNLRVLQPIERH